MRGMSRTRMGLNWLDLLVFNLSAHNVYYVKSGVVNGNPLVIYVKTGKAFFSMSLIVYVVSICCNYKQAINITPPPFSTTHSLHQ